jgi:hypothetical protein
VDSIIDTELGDETDRGKMVRRNKTTEEVKEEEDGQAWCAHYL